MRRFLAATFIILAVLPASATVDDALSFAHEAAMDYVRKGFHIREDAWGGDLGGKDQQACTAQLFRGNEYWFLLATDVKGAVVSVHVYDSEGRLAESEYWQKNGRAGAKVVPNRTGTYYAIVTVERSPRERTHWALIYGYR